MTLFLKFFQKLIKKKKEENGHLLVPCPNITTSSFFFWLEIELLVEEQNLDSIKSKLPPKNRRR